MLARVGLLLVVAVLSALVVVGQPSASMRLTMALASPLPSVSTSPLPLTWDLNADIGAVMVLSWKGTVGWSAVRPVLQRYQVGGVLLFTPNFGGTPTGVHQWSDRLNSLASATCQEHPTLMMLDEEGGAVANVKAPFAPPWPVEMAAQGPAGVRELERINGAGLRAAGVDLNLAPVADVRYNPADEVIGGRSFGSDPTVVAPLVAAAVSGLHEGGVGATVKHFPGLGGAAGDPHVAIPTDRESVSTWTRVQLPSFAAGIAAGADVVMVTAVYVPGLGGSSLPAVFSSAVVSRLRTQLGFTGVVMSDSLSMYGISSRWSLGEAAVMALAAGNDMLLLGSPDLATEASAIDTVRKAVLSGRLDRARIHASAMRVNALRDRWGRRPAPCSAPTTAGLAGAA
jgi:beta-N-acetylhexosaminidase